MKIIGLTGGIGSGKSTVLELFKEFGVTTYIADVEAKKLMNSNEKLVHQIINLFGEQAYANNKLNRNYISSIVFNNSKKLAALNALVHPKVREHFQDFIKKNNAEIVIYEAAILFESGSFELCNYIITVIASFDNKIKRIVKRDGVSEQQIFDRMKHQITDDFRIKKSHFVIRNTELKSTKIQVLTAYELILKLN